MVKIALKDAADDDPMFEQAMDFGDGRTMHVRKMDADDDGNVVEEVVIVSTDIEPPEATLFAMVPGQELNCRRRWGLCCAVDADDAVARDLGNDFTALEVPMTSDGRLCLAKYDQVG